MDWNATKTRQDNVENVFKEIYKILNISELKHMSV